MIYSDSHPHKNPFFREFALAEPNQKQATLHDVARLANVSHQTVSRVINHSPNVSAETRERVQKAIQILNYRPNRAARSLITGRSQTIHIIDFEAGYLAPIPAIISTAGELGYRSSLSILSQTNSDDLRKLLTELSSWMVDGLVLFDPQLSLNAAELESLCRGIPFIQLGGRPVPGIPSVTFDHAYGVEQAMRHLYSLGHRRIAAISGPLNLFDARTRHQTYVDWMKANHLEPGPCLEGNFSAGVAYQLAQDLIRQGGFSAILCGNDETALGVLHALHECGLRVPADISVVGFDDHPHVQFYEPPLTTVRQDSDELSRFGITDLIARIEDPKLQGESLVLEPRLVVRGSTGQVS